MQYFDENQEDYNGDAPGTIDLAQRLKVGSTIFNNKLGEITDYVFNVVGKEAQKEIDQFADQITRIQCDNKTMKMFKD